MCVVCLWTCKQFRTIHFSHHVCSPCKTLKCKKNKVWLIFLFEPGNTPMSLDYRFKVKTVLLNSIKSTELYTIDFN